MNEILQKRIEAESNKYMEEAIEMNSVVGDNLHYKDLKTCFIEAADFALQNQWISVEEGLPEKNTMCFVRKETKLGIIYDADYVDWEGKWFFNSNRTSIESMVITHWMSIPSLEGGEE